MEEGLELIVTVQCAHKDLIRLPTTRQILTAELAVERMLANNTGVAKSGEAQIYGLCTDFLSQRGGRCCQPDDRTAR